MAARADTIKNLLIFFNPVEAPIEKKPKLLINDIPTNATINHGNNDIILMLS